MTGMLRMRPSAIGKKSLKRLRKPQNSTHIPIIAHPNSTSMMPPKKQAVPFHLRIWKKKRNVFSNPMRRTTPARKSSCGRT